MDRHEIDVAVRNADASWCSCTCGWVSSETSEDDAATMWAAHVAERALSMTTRRPEL